MEGFDISTERIATAANEVGGVGAALQQEIATMDTILGEISAGWRSTTAAPKFVASMQGYLEQARTLTTALLGHADGLATTGKQFAATEQAVADATVAVAL